MTAFKEAINNETVLTENGMVALATTGSSCVDLFYAIGASRGADIIPSFIAAYAENRDVAVRIALWARDVRGGAGERQAYRDILTYLVRTDSSMFYRLFDKTVELGRWDDVWSVYGLSESVDKFIVEKIVKTLGTDGLLAKWLPRKPKTAELKGMISRVRTGLRLDPKAYRQYVASLTKVTETKMCNKEFSSIDFKTVPSVCHTRNRKAFSKNAPDAYSEYIGKVESGKTTINASSVYPHTILQGCYRHDGVLGKTELERKSIIAQWSALPDYVGDHDIIPLVDVSRSMTSPVGGSKIRTTPVTCMDVALSLGLYISERGKGPFKDVCLTFTSTPKLLHLKGNVLERVSQLSQAEWRMNTDLQKALKLILTTGLNNKVEPENMPKTLVILSDMQFDAATKSSDTALSMVKSMYERAGYEMPKVVFWNLRNSQGKPASTDAQGVSLVSGFSPSIMKTMLGGATTTPLTVLTETVMGDRYAH